MFWTEECSWIIQKIAKYRSTEKFGESDIFKNYIRDLKKSL